MSRGINGVGHEHQLGGYVVEVVRSVERDLQGKPATMVYEILNLRLTLYEILKLRLTRGLPPVTADDDLLRDAAARIAAGVHAL
jgi:hypothetical protein